MKTPHCIATALALVLMFGCGEHAPTAPAEPQMTAERFETLRESAIRIANRVAATGEITAADRIEIEALQRELEECVRTGVGPLASSTSASAPGDGAPTGSCTPCPFIISNGNCIGVLRSSGPCRPGAGLERCFYNWYCYGSTG